MPRSSAETPPLIAMPGEHPWPEIESPAMPPELPPVDDLGSPL